MSKASPFYLTLYPIPLTPDEVESYLDRLNNNDDAAKKIIICFIEHRLNHRYIRPLLHIPKDFKSGFLMMATSCLLIEALQSFYEGKNVSDDPDENGSDQIGSECAFKKFFEKHKEFFPNLRACFPITSLPNKKGDLKPNKCSFYKYIRCGILHQAETTGGFRILRKGLLFDKDKQAINANLFVKAMKDCLDEYIESLRAEKCDSNVWKKAVLKIGHICKNCRI